MLGECRYRVEGGIRSTLGLVPMTNVWLGTTVENQEQAERRIPELLWIPAAVRFPFNRTVAARPRQPHRTRSRRAGGIDRRLHWGP